MKIRKEQKKGKWKQVWEDGDLGDAKALLVPVDEHAVPDQVLEQGRTSGVGCIRCAKPPRRILRRRVWGLTQLRYPS